MKITAVLADDFFQFRQWAVTSGYTRLSDFCNSDKSARVVFISHPDDIRGLLFDRVIYLGKYFQFHYLDILVRERMRDIRGS